MVRLKESIFFIYSNRERIISIPYGAIKRNCSQVMTMREPLISIPYGAIKSRFIEVI